MIRKILKEWLLIATIIGVITTSLILKKFPLYSKNDFEILFILFTLFVIVKGIENSNFFKKIETFVTYDRFLPFKLVTITAILSMIVTNDVALLIIVPLTLTLEIKNKGFVVILEALSANAGSALTPFGNPQNMFIYWFYHLNFLEFLKTIYPFTVFSLILIFIMSFFVSTPKIEKEIKLKEEKISKELYIYFTFLVMFILVIFHILPIWTGIFPVLYTLFFSRKNFKIDYVLLATFFFFFGFTDNLKVLINLKLNTTGHVFLLSAFLSQFISNVPAALIFSDFTKNWQALLWGVNVGGYGNIIGSLANLIAYRFYVNRYDDKRYFIKFNLLCTIFFILNILFFYKIH